jgi:hypothetical protein
MNIKSALMFSVSTAALLVGVNMYLHAHATFREYDKIAFNYNWDSILPVDSILPATEVRTSSGQSLSSRQVSAGVWTLMILTPRFDPKTLEYPRVIAQRYKARGFKVVSLLAPTDENRSATRTFPSDSLTQLVIDERRELATMLGLPSDGVDYVWSILLDPEGRVKFAMPRFIAADALRQLVERHLLGHVNYVLERQASGYAHGAKIPDIVLHSVAGDKHTLRLRDLARPSTTIIFFRAYCTSCGVDSIFGQLVRLQAAGVRFDGRTVVPVFSNAFDEASIAGQYQVHRGAPPTFRADAAVSEWEDAYASRSDAMTEPRVVVVGPDGTIERTAEFFAWSNAETGIPNMPRRDAAPTSPWQPIAQDSGIILSWIRAIAPMPDGGFAVLDSKDNRIVVYDTNGQAIRHVGGIGQGPTDLFRPFSLSTALNRFTVIDQDGLIAKQLNFDGTSGRQWHLPTVTDSVAVSDNGDIFVNIPRNNVVAAAVDPSGTITRRYGPLLNVNDGYPARLNSESLRIPLSRAWLVPRAQGGVTAAFQFVPLVRSYLRSGELAWQVRLEGKNVDALTGIFWNAADAPHPRAVKSIDAIQFPLMITAATVDEHQRTWIALADGSLTVIDSRGSVVGNVPATFTPRDGTWSALLVRGDGVILCSSEHCYRAALSKIEASFGASDSRSRTEGR